jgi:hypothetical protein
MNKGYVGCMVLKVVKALKQGLCPDSTLTALITSIKSDYEICHC